MTGADQAARCGQECTWAADPSFEGRPQDDRDRPGRPVMARRRRGALLPTLAILVAVIILVLIGANFWTDLLWYESVGFRKVFTTELVAKVLLFVIGGLIAGGAVFSSLVIAFRTRPVYAPVSPEQASLDRYREQIEPLRKIGTIVVPIAVGLLSGGAAAGQWQTYLLWRHRQPFGTSRTRSSTSTPASTSSRCRGCGSSSAS